MGLCVVDLIEGLCIEGMRCKDERTGVRRLDVVVHERGRRQNNLVQMLYLGGKSLWKFFSDFHREEGNQLPV